MTFNKKYKYDGEMDKEVINLCNAINSLPGIETTGSCCGHEKSVFRIYFQVTSLPQGLFFLARCCDLRYFKHEWKIEVEVSDAMRDNILPTTFWLHSINKGDKSYKEAQDLIVNMNKHLNHKNFIKGYNLDISKFDL